jgi:hypothetical protein
MKIHATRLLAAALMLFSVTAAIAEDDHAYTEGPVVNVSYIRTEPGKFDEYLRYLSTTYKALMEEQKRAGIIQDYAVYAAVPRTPQDADLILTVTYKNMAALDGLNAKTDPLVKKVFSSLGKADEASAERGKLRTQLGSEFVRKLELK